MSTQAKDLPQLRHGQPRSAARTAPGADRSRTVFLVCLGVISAAAVFLSGVAWQSSKPWPHKEFAAAIDSIKDALKYGEFAPQFAVGDAPSGAQRATMTLHQPDKVQPGYRAVTGYSRELKAYAVWLFNPAGELVHTRAIDYFSADPDGPAGGAEAPHAMHVMPDGSVVINYDKGDTLARFDTCGKAIWSRSGAWHHSFAADPEGGLWTLKGELSAFSQYQYMVRFDPEDGKTLESIGLVEDVVDADPSQRTLFGMVPGQTFKHEKTYRSLPDLFHPNDLEPLTPEMAKYFPQFDAGDLLISLRNMDMVAVLDRQSLQVKWWSRGPWHSQHDPEFTRDGRIAVYNNNLHRPFSSIVLIDPQTREVETMPLENDARFSSSYMGKQSWLENGTVQIVVPAQGRAVEVDAQGKLVLEYNNLFSERYNAFISDMNILSPDYFTVPPEKFNCNQEMQDA